MRFFLRWLLSLWLWIRKNVPLPRLIITKYDHDSDYSDSDDDDVCRVPYDSRTGVYDEVDHVNSDGGLGRATRILEVSLRRNDEEKIVRMRNPYCVLIININFDSRMGPRNGGEADRENIERLLSNAGFNTVHVHNDVVRKDTLEIMDRISNSPEIAAHDGLLVFISSHGRRKGILTTDKKIVEVDEMTSRVNGKQCEALRGKPKMFFISACRGTKTDRGVPIKQGPITHDAGFDEKVVPRLPTQADFLVCYSTTPDHISHRRFTLGVKSSPKMGTWLISALTRVFEERMKDEDVMEMLTRVNAIVADMSSHDDHVNGTKQMPVQMFMLRHRVYLGHPDRIS